MECKHKHKHATLGGFQPLEISKVNFDTSEWCMDPPSHALLPSAPAGRWSPVTTTGYRSCGTSSSRPNRRRTRRSSDTPTASTSHGWVSDWKLCLRDRSSSWAWQSRNVWEQFPAMHRWALQWCVSKAAVWLMDFSHLVNFGHVEPDQRLLSTASSPCATRAGGETHIANLILLFVLFTNSWLRGDDNQYFTFQNWVNTIWNLASSICSMKFNQASGLLWLSMLLYCQTLADKTPNFRDAPTPLAKDLWLVSHILFFAPSKPWN